jgi:hypothetical protein
MGRRAGGAPSGWPHALIFRVPRTLCFEQRVRLRPVCGLFTWFPGPVAQAHLNQGLLRASRSDAQEHQNRAVEPHHIFVREASHTRPELSLGNGGDLIHHQSADSTQAVRAVGLDRQAKQGSIGRVGRESANRDRICLVESIVLKDHHWARFSRGSLSGVYVDLPVAEPDHSPLRYRVANVQKSRFPIPFGIARKLVIYPRSVTFGRGTPLVTVRVSYLLQTNHLSMVPTVTVTLRATPWDGSLRIDH